MTDIRRSLVLSIVERYAIIVLGLSSHILIARLLTPEEIGIFSVSLALLGVMQVLRDFGIGTYIIQEKNLTDMHLRTATTVSLGIGALLFLVVTCSAHWVGGFYREPRLSEVLVVSAGNLLFLPFCVVPLALLRREMRFGILLRINVAAAVGGVACSLYLAYEGHGPMGLAIGGIVSNAITAIGAWLFVRRFGLLLPNFLHWRGVVSFGAQSSVAGILTAVSMDINDLVVGKLLGFGPVAILSRAQGLMNLFHRDFMGAIRNVALPVFSEAHRSADSVEGRHVHSIAVVTALAWPFYGFIAMFGLEVMRLLFGKQWDEAVALVPLFCLAGSFAATASLVTSAMLAVGRIDLVTQSEVLFQPFRAGLVVAAAWAFGTLAACAGAYLASFILYVPVIYAFKQRCIPTHVGRMGRHFAQSLVVTAIALTAPFIVVCMHGFDRPEPISLAAFLSSGLLMAASWVVGIFVVRHPLAFEPSVQKLVTWFSGRCKRWTMWY